MPAPKGHPRYGGREKGTPNKLSKTAKENIAAVFDKLGGLESMAEWALENKTEFYRGIYPRMLPIDTHVSGSLGSYTAVPVSERDPLDAASGTPAGSDKKALDR